MNLITHIMIMISHKYQIHKKIPMIQEMNRILADLTLIVMMNIYLIIMHKKINLKSKKIIITTLFS